MNEVDTETECQHALQSIGIHACGCFIFESCEDHAGPVFPLSWCCSSNKAADLTACTLTPLL